MRAYYVHDGMHEVRIVHFYEAGTALVVDEVGDAFLASCEDLKDISDDRELELDTVFVRWLRHTLLCKSCFKSYPDGVGCEAGARLKEAWLVAEGKGEKVS